jgi:signal transduction histidine kinase
VELKRGAKKMPVRIDHVSIKSCESRLKERNRELSLILELSTFLSGSINLEDILGAAISQTLEHFDLEAGRIYLLDPGGELLDLAACKGMDPQGLEKIKVSEGFSGKAVSTRSFIAQYVEEMEDRQRALFLEHYGFKIVICVPLMVSEKVIGVMNLATSKDIELDQDQIDLLIAVANQVAIAANHAKLYQDLEKKEKTMEFITYSISHDLKSPAVGAYGIARLLQKQYANTLDEKGKTYCEQILKATGQVMALVNDMRTYVGAKETPLKIEEVDLNEIVELIRSELAQRFDEQHVKLQVPKSLPKIWADSLSTTRVLQNLVDNALKYGGKVLGKITIGCTEDKDHDILFVQDDGIGVSRKDSERIFELFQRGRTSAGVSGSGLGLAIVKEIAERHKGKAWIKSRPSGGTTFYVSTSKRLKP